MYSDYADIRINGSFERNRLSPDTGGRVNGGTITRVSRRLYADFDYTCCSRAIGYVLDRMNGQMKAGGPALCARCGARADGRMTETWRRHWARGRPTDLWIWFGNEPANWITRSRVRCQFRRKRLSAAFVLHNNGSVGKGAPGLRAERRCVSRANEKRRRRWGGGGVWAGAKALSAFPTRIPSESEQKRNGVPM